MPLRSRLVAITLTLVACFLALPACAPPAAPPASPTGVELLGMAGFDWWTRYEDSLVGGLSGITYDAATDSYLVVSDDRGRFAPPRAYRLRVDLSDGRLAPDGVTITGLIFVRDDAGQVFAPGLLDLEGITAVSSGQLYVASEGDAGIRPPINPAVYPFAAGGALGPALPLPPYYLPDRRGERGVRDNLALESLTASADGRRLVTAVENALLQDGPQATLQSGSSSRLLAFDMGTGLPGAEYVYLVGPVVAPPLLPGLYAGNGLVDLQALPADGSFLALERSYSLGMGHTVRVYRTNTTYATDVAGWPALRGSTYAPMSRELLFDFAALGLQPDNIEGMTFGPRLADGRATLLFVSDNNFNPLQQTQIIAVALADGA